MPARSNGRVTPKVVKLVTIDVTPAVAKVLRSAVGNTAVASSDPDRRALNRAIDYIEDRLDAAEKMFASDKATIGIGEPVPTAE